MTKGSNIISILRIDKLGIVLPTEVIETRASTTFRFEPIELQDKSEIV